MGDDDEGGAGFVDFVKRIEDLVGRLRVEVACGLVGEDDGWTVGDGAGDRDALLFAGAQLGRVMVGALGEVESRKEPSSLLKRRAGPRARQG